MKLNSPIPLDTRNPSKNKVLTTKVATNNSITNANFIGITYINQKSIKNIFPHSEIKK